MDENRNVSYALIWKNNLCYNYNIFAVDEEIKKGNVKWFGSKQNVEESKCANRRTDNTMANREMTEWQTMTYNTPHRKLSNEQHEQWVWQNWYGINYLRGSTSFFCFLGHKINYINVKWQCGQRKVACVKQKWPPKDKCFDQIWFRNNGEVPSMNLITKTRRKIIKLGIGNATREAIWS